VGVPGLFDNIGTKTKKMTEIIAVLVALILWGYFTRSIWLDDTQNKEDDN